MAALGGALRRTGFTVNEHFEVIFNENLASPMIKGKYSWTGSGFQQAQ
jgi:hypothetical protein